MIEASIRHCSGSVPVVALPALTLPTPVLGAGPGDLCAHSTGLPEPPFDTDPAEASTQLPDDREAGARADLGQAGKTGRPNFYRIQLEERCAGSRILASGWEELPGFCGGTNERAFDDPLFHNALVDLMVEAGGRLPPGTRFPNHAMIGADSVARTRPEPSLEVTEVEPDSPAMRAGLQAGDLVTRIANRRTRTLEDLNRSLVEAASAANFEIRFLREGREKAARVWRCYGPNSGRL